MKLHNPSVAVRLIFLLSTIPGVAIAFTLQKPLLNPNPETEITDSTSGWNFNFSSSAPHYFASVYGLLQQWPNTFFPNGHSIAPCEIPAFTKLYHGRQDGDVPPSPEWVAFDMFVPIFKKAPVSSIILTSHRGMSYGIMGGSRNSHMLTYQTTRGVKCIYFDGESAALMGSGQLDTQMLHIYGNTSGAPPPDSGFRGLWEEYARALGLCDWIKEKNLGGSGWGVEGIVRMNAGFEMIWCNFSSVSIRLVSHLNITAPLLPPSEDDGDDEDGWVEESSEEGATPTSYYPLPPSPTKTNRASDPTNPPAPPNWRRDWDREPFYRTQTWNWFTAGAAHYGSSGSGSGLGETRVKILGCGFMSYYGPKFMSAAISQAEEEQQNLNLTKEGLWKGPGSNGTRFGGLTALTRRRRVHTLGDVSPEDAATMRDDSERVLLDLISNPTNCSGIDWTIITNEIVQTYADDLASFLKMLQTFGKVSKKNETALRDWVVEVRDQTHSFLLPFLEFPNTTSEEDWKRDSTLFKDTFSRCRFHYTRLLDPNEGVFLGPEESTLKWAVEETTSGICSVLVDVGLSMEGVWDSNFNLPANTSVSPSVSESLGNEVQRWIEGVEELMAWLGWAGEWASCDRKCAWDEKCFIPMWPLIKMGFGGGPGRRPPGGRRPGYGGPGYGRPGYGGPPPNRTDWPPNNRTGRRPGGGFRWQPDESDLWQPKCVKYDYLLR
jgi:hypothetical protein